MQKETKYMLWLWLGILMIVLGVIGIIPSIVTSVVGNFIILRITGLLLLGGYLAISVSMRKLDALPKKNDDFSCCTGEVDEN
tara:strand:+ start:8284 stop:8529 length:246 start_codon:yes stop_codon:yes gene_type:complete